MDGIFPLPFNTLLKWTPGTREEEALAQTYAWKMGLPVPRMLSYGSHPPGKNYPTSSGSIIMTRIPGETLNNVLESLSNTQLETIATDLGSIVTRMRRFRSPYGSSICNVIGGNIRTVRVTDMSIGPCPDFPTFHRDLVWAANPSIKDYDHHRESFRRLLDKQYAIVFTHGDLLSHNIMVQDGHVTGLIDWECSGWMPEYWDFTSMLRGPRRTEDDEWLRIWKAIPINCYHEEYESEFSLWRLTQDSWSYG
ncbi:hypothetical protein EWM64_g2593 [Hericium alpestre]|uniref:Aminoglycoside phosphotransferase domain-containing protein n=1 Tax=Hericium alpestre TaxID=135208 RepID=A0A4Z0A691_9AGAM|nr:hypothetical protein EWM64_g2593 [Hericium alpestre]